MFLIKHTLCSTNTSTRYGSHGPSLHDDTDNPNYSKLSLGIHTTVGYPPSHRPLPNPHTQGPSSHTTSLNECATPLPSTYAVVSVVNQFEEQQAVATSLADIDAANLYETISNLDLQLEKDDEAQPYAEPVVTKIKS